MKRLHLDSSIICRLDAAEHAFFGGIARATNQIAGSDVCSVIEKRGFRAYFAPTVSDPLFNRMLISTECDVSEVGAVLDGQFGEAQRHIEISPGALNEELGAALMSRGYAQTQFLPILVNYTENVSEEEPKLDVKLLTEQDELSTFKKVLVAGWTIPPAELSETLAASVEEWMKLPGFSLVLALEGDEAVSCGILHCFDGIAFLAVSATPPQCRGRGGQSAIDRARVNAAKQANAELIFSRTYFASISQRNKEKLGLNVAYMRAEWTKLPGIPRPRL
ncbi:MAG: hypothetical protein SFV17_00270 [Candidatus Obscuribacter sp.]|nr:hypothetical protein [Candidatus Obscuribacter sp.]